MLDRHSVITSEEFGRLNGKGNTARDSHAPASEGLFYLRSGIASSCCFLGVVTYMRGIILAANKGTNSMPFHKSSESSDCHGRYIVHIKFV